MNALVYNLALLLGLALVGVGAALWSVPAALVVVGLLIVALTVYGAHLATRG